MEVRDLNTISEDLVSNDEDKCISSLQQVIKRVNRADDISLFWNGIFSNFSSQKSRTIRLLVYYILQTNSDISQSYWESLFPTILEDMNGNDQAIQIEAFRLLPHIPESILTKSIEEDVLTPAVFQTQESSIAFRQCVVETLLSLLVYSSQIYKITKFREFGWSYLSQKAFDTSPVIINTVFTAIGVLFMYQEDNYYPSRTDYQKDWDNINATKRESFKKTADFMTKQLIPRYNELLERVLTIDASLRWTTIFPIAYISSKSFTAKNELTAELSISRSRMTDLINRLKIMLNSTDDALVYECGIAILYLNRKLGYIPGLSDTVITCFCSMINNKQPPVTILQLYNAIFSSITKLIPRRIFECLSLILSNGHLITDFRERIGVILKCWKFWINNSFTNDKHFISTFFSQRWVVELFANPKFLSYRNELITMLILSTKEYYLNSTYLKTISNIILASKFFMSWQDIDEYTFDVYLLILDHVYYHKAENSNDTLKFISDNINSFKSIPSRYAKLLFLLSKHLSPPLTEIPGLILNGLFSNTNAKEEVIVILPNKSSSNEGKLGSTVAAKELPSTQSIDLSLRTLSNVYLRGIEKDKQVVKDLMEELIQQLQNNPLQQKKFQTHLKLLLSNSLKPIYEQVLFSSPISAIPYLIVSKELQDNRKGVYIGEDFPPQEITGNSSPIAIQASHTLNLLINRLSLNFKIFNRTDIPLSSIRLILCLNGNLKSEINSPQIYKYIPLLEYRMTVEWDVKLLVTSFSAISFRLQISFLRAEENGYSYPISKFNSLPYSIPLSELLIPIDIAKEEFYQLWNSFPVGFHVHFTSRVANSEELLGYFLDSPFSVVDQPNQNSPEFIQACFISATKFNELFCFVLTGKYEKSKWICRIEFRSSSAVSLFVLESHFESWITQISQKHFKLLNWYADENIFSNV